jgi:SAM-dependent methyltransferase
MADQKLHAASLGDPVEEAQRLLRSNEELWDNWTDLHLRSAFYDVAGFRAGRSSLQSIEREELGDVAGKSLLHLQCHFGLDTLSWARLGAAVTGVDFSGRAITAAGALAKELGLPARFVQSDVYGSPALLRDQFDIVFTSYGVLFWLPDLRRWADIITHFLKPGGVFYIVEFHPFANVFATEGVPELQPAYPYFPGPAPLRFETHGSYAAPKAAYRSVEYGWDHPLGEIVTALLAAGLRLEFLHEFPHCGYQRFSFLEEGTDGRWRLPGHLAGMLPLLFSLKAMR